MSSFLDAFQNPIISTLRKGTQDDPFLHRQDRHVVQNNYVYLQELPDDFNLFLVSNPDDETETYTRITTGIPTTYQFLVDYTFGIVQFSPDANNKNLLFDYYGRGGFFWPVSRVWTLQNSGQVTQTLQQILDTQARSIIFSTDDPIDEDENPNGSLWFKYTP